MVYVCMAPRKFPSAFPVFSLMFVVIVSAHQTSIRDHRCIGPFFLVSPNYFSIPSRVTLGRHYRPLSPGMHTHYPTDSGKRTDFLVVSVILLSIHYFLALAVHSSGSGKATGREDSAIGTCALTTGSVTRFGLGFLSYSPETSNGEGENELGGWGVGGLHLLVHFVFAMIYPPEPCFLFFFPIPPNRSVVTAVLSVRPPCTSLHSCRARRSYSCLRPPLVACQFCSSQRITFSFFSPSYISLYSLLPILSLCFSFLPLRRIFTPIRTK